MMSLDRLSSLQDTLGPKAYRLGSTLKFRVNSNKADEAAVREIFERELHKAGRKWLDSSDIEELWLDTWLFAHDEGRQDRLEEHSMDAGNWG